MGSEVVHKMATEDGGRRGHRLMLKHSSSTPLVQQPWAQWHTKSHPTTHNSQILPVPVSSSCYVFDNAGFVDPIAAIDLYSDKSQSPKQNSRFVTLD
jgi:hypothetical protein